MAFLNKLPAAVLFIFSIFLFSCSPLALDEPPVIPTHSSSGGGYFGGGSSGGAPSSVENEIPGIYTGNDGYSIDFSSDKTGNITGGSSPNMRAAGGVLPPGSFHWSATGSSSSATVVITMDSTNEVLTASFSSAGSSATLSISEYGKQFTRTLQSMDDSDYTPPDLNPIGNYNTIIKDSAFFGSIMHPAVKGGEAVNVPLKFVIVSDPQFKNTLQKYVKHKRTQGFNVVEIYRENNESAEALRQKIIREHYANATEENPSPAYVLLCGDHDNLPAFNAQTLDNGKHYYTDYHYGRYTDSWTQNAMVGRFSAKNESELNAQIEKTMYMEQHGGTNTYLSVGKQNEEIETDQTQWVSEYIKSAGISGDYIGYTQSDVVREINKGRGFVFHAGHSAETLWAVSQYGGRSLDSTSASNLTNKNNYPVVMSMSCYSATFAYYSDCVGEALLKNPNGGAVGYIGATITSKAAINPFMSEGWRNWNDGGRNDYSKTPDSLGPVAALYHARGESKKYWARSMGELLYSGVRAIETQYEAQNYASGAEGYLSRRYHEIYVLLGDPTYMPYTATAQQANITPLGQALTGRSLAIQTAPFARLALTREKDGKVEIIAVTVSNEFGRAVLHIPEETEVGDAVLSSIAQNYYMNTQTISIVQGVQPKNGDATLSKLTVKKSNDATGVEDVSLETGKFDYEYEVPYEVTVVTISSAANANTSAVYGTGTRHLEVGENDVEIKVVAEDLTSQTYKLKIIRKDTTKSKDYSIKTLKIDGVIVSPRVSSEWYYDYKLNGKTQLTIEVVMNNRNAKCWIQGVTDSEEEQRKAAAKNNLREVVTLNASGQTAFGDFIPIYTMSEFDAANEHGEKRSFTVKFN